MKTFALALLATSALGSTSTWNTQGDWGQPASWATKSKSQWNAPAPPKSLPHSPYHGSHDPFRYSAPQMTYVPAKLAKPQYAECFFWTFDMRLLFGQLPGHPIEVRGRVEQGTYYGNVSFKIRQYGVVETFEDETSDTDSNFCFNKMGHVYNPLAHPDHVDTDPHGALMDAVIPDSYQAPYVWEFAKPLFQNLGTSEASIVGRGIEAYLSGEGANGFGYDCCPIALTAAPAPDPTAPAYHPHYHPAPHYSYGHGGYGGHGHGAQSHSSSHGHHNQHQDQHQHGGYHY